MNQLKVYLIGLTVLFCIFGLINGNSLEFDWDDAPLEYSESYVSKTKKIEAVHSSQPRTVLEYASHRGDIPIDTSDYVENTSEEPGVAPPWGGVVNVKPPQRGDIPIDTSDYVENTSEEPGVAPPWGGVVNVKPPQRNEKNTLCQKVVQLAEECLWPN